MATRFGPEVPVVPGPATWRPRQLTTTLVRDTEREFGIRMSIEPHAGRPLSPSYHFTFLNWDAASGIPEPDTEERFQMMADLIRQRRDVDHIAAPVIRFLLPNQTHQHEKRWSMNPETFNLNWLLIFFEQLRDLYPDLELIGLRITMFDAAAGLMDHHNNRIDPSPPSQGARRGPRGGAWSEHPTLPPGCQWKNFGLERHPDEVEASRDVVPASACAAAVAQHREIDALVNRAALCGARAFLYTLAAQQSPAQYKPHPHKAYFGATPDKTDDSLYRLVKGAWELGEAMGWTEEKRGIPVVELGRIVEIPVFSHLRIVVMRDSGVPYAIKAGEHWVPRYDVNAFPDHVDPATVHLLLYNNHYFAITNIDAFMRKVWKDKASSPNGPRRSVTCRGCYAAKIFRRAELRQGEEEHRCEASAFHKCDVCWTTFCSMEGLRDHEDEGGPNVTYPACEICGKGDFHGSSCYMAHIRLKCRPPQVEQVKVKCDSCPMWFIEGNEEQHKCYPSGCSNCDAKFSGPNAKQEWNDHRCELQRNTKYYRPVKVTGKAGAGQKRRGNGPEEATTVYVEGVDGVSRQMVLLPRTVVWKAHWVYDFETNRARELDGRCWELDVMGWSLRLSVQCARTAQYMVSYNVVEEMQRIFHEWKRNTGNTTVEMRIVPRKSTAPCVEDVAETIKFRGTGIADFLDTLTDVCSGERTLETGDDTAQKHAWQVVAWAHNGSKFDSKFVFDHLVNDRSYDVRPAGKTVVSVPVRDKQGVVSFVQRAFHQRVRADALELTNVGSRILTMTVGAVTFRCTAAHHPTELRDMPGIFGLKDGTVKGEFPYGWLQPSNFGKQHAMGLPPLWDYDPQAKRHERRREMVEWWLEEQLRRNVPYEEVERIFWDPRSKMRPEEAFMLSPYSLMPGAVVEPWDFTTEFYRYLEADVDVLAECVEAYHRTAETLGQEILKTLDPNDTRRVEGHIVSPLDASTAPGYAFCMYRTWFLPPLTVYVLKPKEYRFIRDSLKGGRTDMRCTYMEVTPAAYAAGHRIFYSDVTSLYPSVMDCAVHGTHFPVGVPWWIRLDPDPRYLNWHETVTSNVDLLYHMDRLEATGFLKVDVKCTKVVTHPTLSHKGTRSRNPEENEPDGEGKLLFANMDLKEQTYGWPELRDAMEAGEVEVVRVHDGQLFRKGTAVFADYIAMFFKLKEMASRPGSKNKGLVKMAKMLLNSLWGKLGQRTYPVYEFISDVHRLHELYKQFDNGTYEQLSITKHVDTKTLVQYRDPANLDHIKQTAPHLAAFVAMWGRVILKRKIREHGQRVLYCDTDSVVVYWRPGDPEVHSQDSALGKWADDLQKVMEDNVKHWERLKEHYWDPFIYQWVALAPKTYSLRLRCMPKDPRTHKRIELYKTVNKGFELSWANSQRIHFHSMKALQWTQQEGMFEAVNALRQQGGVVPEDSDDEDAEVLWLTPEERVTRAEREQRNLRDRAGLAYLTTREKKFRPRHHIVGAERLQMKSSVASNNAKPVETHLAKILKGEYTKGRTHPRQPMLVVPFANTGEQLPNGGRTFLDRLMSTEQFI